MRYIFFTQVCATPRTSMDNLEIPFFHTCTVADEEHLLHDFSISLLDHLPTLSTDKHITTWITASHLQANLAHTLSFRITINIVTVWLVHMFGRNKFQPRSPIIHNLSIQQALDPTTV